MTNLLFSFQTGGADLSALLAIVTDISDKIDAALAAANLGPLLNDVVKCIAKNLDKTHLNQLIEDLGDCPTTIVSALDLSDVIAAINLSCLPLALLDLTGLVSGITSIVGDALGTVLSDLVENAVSVLTGLLPTLG